MPLARKNASFSSSSSSSSSSSYLDDGFFRRNGFTGEDVEGCLGVVKRRYPGWGVEGVRGQGGCSYTVFVRKRGEGEGEGETVAVQFRLLAHRIHEGIVRDVRQVFGDLVPEPLWFEEVSVGEDVRLQVCGMSRVKGVAFGGVQPCGRGLSGREFGRLRGLMGDLAGFFARSWRAARRDGGCGRLRGKVSASIRERLVMLERGLPRRWLRLRARSARRGFDSGVLDRLPIVLNHGDLLPSNIMVDRESWRLTGLVDWAEAEYLPFGMSLYGIEHLLGGFDNETQMFVYYDQANEPRDTFWHRLRVEIPELRDRDIWKAVILSRDIGILLWHGIAWDDGRIDRVVDHENDREELAYLESFLGGSCGSRESKL